MEPATAELRPGYGANYGGPPSGYGQPYVLHSMLRTSGYLVWQLSTGSVADSCRVAAGEMAFRGIEDLMHALDRVRATSRIVHWRLRRTPRMVNNYYGDEHKNMTALVIACRQPTATRAA